MKEDRLDYVIRTYGIRTVINLRGESCGEDWWETEKAVCKRHGVVHHDEHWSAMRPPPPASLDRVVRWLETADKPILVHCHAGVHRAATAAAVYRLMQGAGPAAARGEFGFFFLDHGVGDIVDYYEASSRGRPFVAWSREVYPGLYAEQEAAQAAAGPAPRSLRAP
jgi:protein tyrosine phosphatase (PTP) superfamily phosphohydrolase (DUF442 family)